MLRDVKLNNYVYIYFLFVAKHIYTAISVEYSNYQTSGFAEFYQRTANIHIRKTLKVSSGHFSFITSTTFFDTISGMLAKTKSKPAVPLIHLFPKELLCAIGLIRRIIGF